jgi:molecular chaperone DnaK
VSAKDKASGKEQRVVITPTSGLTEAEIQQMVREAEQHASEDARRREEVDLRNRADNLAYSAERLIHESGDSLPSELKLEIEDQFQSLRQALGQDDAAGLRRALEALERSIERAQEAATPVGAAAGGRSSGSSGSNGSGSDSEGGTPPGTVEGEYREV